ncbi:MAG: TonB-dependent receptor, partial [Candidatus Poribacteria bacterium]|nr:TonB-dependent receptor [Candidatus Poribacteria bacterium]
KHTVGVGESVLNWTASYSRAERDEPDTRETIYELRNGRYRFRDITQSGSRFWFDLADNEFSGRVDWIVPVVEHAVPEETVLDELTETADPKVLPEGDPLKNGLGAHNANSKSWKIGVMGRDRRRGFDARRFRFTPSDGIEERVDITAPPEEMFAAENIAPDRFELLESTRPTDNYEASQSLAAGYVQHQTAITNKLTALLGARVESSWQQVTTYDPFSTSIVPIQAELNSVDLLPGANFRYSMTPRMSLRSSVSRTLTRPDLREMAPFEFTNFVGGRKEVGNPNLDRTRILNLDAGWELYPRPDELLSINIFYKKITKPIEVIIQPSAEVITSYANADGARHFGAEVELRQRLDRLYRPLKFFLFNVNATFLNSRVELPEDIGVQTSLDRPLQGQSPYLVNLTLVYDNPNRNFSAATTYHTFGRRIAEVGEFGLPDVYEERRSELNASLDKQLTDRVRVSFGAKNLTAPIFLLTQGDSPLVEYKTGRSLSFSVRYNL